jgi:hypothetical protein
VGELSDWDFLVETDDFGAVAADLPSLCVPLRPIGQQWDRLGSYNCWMLMLRGPTKVDLIFADEPHQDEPPWRPAAENLSAIDLHFWDWLWLRSKEAAGKDEIVASELEKLFEHILSPLGVAEPPLTLPSAVAAYRQARAQNERLFDVRVPRRLEREVAPSLGL